MNRKHTSRWKRWLWGLGAFLLSLLLVVAGLIGYVGYRAARAKQNVESLCAEFSPGTAAEAFDGRARALGLSPSRAGQSAPDAAERSTVQAASDGVLLSHWVCEIEVVNGRVSRGSVRQVE